MSDILQIPAAHVAAPMSRAAATKGCGDSSPAPLLTTAAQAGMGTMRFRLVKRLLDIIIASCALVLTGPVILIAALAVKFSSRGPVFYGAKRAGLAARPFVMFKLRTMRVGSDTPDRKVTEACDDRLTAAGRWLRRFKIDELPQLWNVLRGDMAIVGPRPEDWDIVQHYYSTAQRRVLEVRPGIASPVDVRWYPDLTYHDPAAPGVPIQEHYVRRHLPVQVAEALRYVDRQSLLLDFQVILGLIFCVLVHSWLPPAKRPLPAATQGSGDEGQKSRDANG